MFGLEQADGIFKRLFDRKHSQNQAQLVSAVRTALDTSAGPFLLDAGLQLATKLKVDLLRNPTNYMIKDQAVPLDAAPAKFDHEMSSSPNIKDKGSDITYTSGWIMVKLEIRDFCLLWGLAVLILFEGRNQDKNETFLHFSSSCAYSVNGKLAGEVPTNVDSKSNAVALYALQCLSNKGFYVQEMLSSKLCLELLQILMYPVYINSPWTITLVLSILEQSSSTFVINGAR
eukprot:Gb_38770 [translate_table: standard]